MYDTKICFSIIVIIQKIFLKRNLTILRRQTFMWLSPHLEIFTPSTKLNPHLCSGKCPTPPYTAGLDKPSTPSPPGWWGGRVETMLKLLNMARGISWKTFLHPMPYAGHMTSFRDVIFAIFLVILLRNCRLSPYTSFSR